MNSYVQSTTPVRAEIGDADTLEIRLLGGFEIKRGNAILSPPATPKSRSLLAYLVLNHDRLAHRDVICATLWPDESEPVARKALRSALWRVRSALGAAGGCDDYVYCDPYQIGFRSSVPMWVDVWEFEATIAAAEFKSDEALGVAEGELLARTALLYRGNCAAGVYDEWIAAEQLRLHHAHLALLERIAKLHASQQRWRQAIIWAERALSVDPLREHLHRIIISCHLSLGDRPSALRQFATCEATLKSELDIEPMAETVALIEGVQARGGLSADRDETVGPRSPLPGAELKAVVSTLRRIAHRLDGTHAHPPLASRGARKLS